jgi:hypothetical protein
MELPRPASCCKACPAASATNMSGGQRLLLLALCSPTYPPPTSCSCACPFTHLPCLPPCPPTHPPTRPPARPPALPPTHPPHPPTHPPTHPPALPPTHPTHPPTHPPSSLPAHLQDACGTCDADCSLVCKAMQQAGLSTDTTQLLVLHPKTLAEVLASITTIGTAAGVADRAQQLVHQLQGRLQAVAAAVQAYCPGAAASTVGQQLSAAVAEKASAAGSSQPLSGEPCQGQNLVADVSTGTGSHPQQPLRQGLTAAAAAAARNGLAGCSHCSCQEVQAPRVLSLEGVNPLVLGGQWLPDVKLAAGAVDASGQQPGDAPARITWEQVNNLNRCHASSLPSRPKTMADFASGGS